MKLRLRQPSPILENSNDFCTPFIDPSLVRPGPGPVLHQLIFLSRSASHQSLSSVLDSATLEIKNWPIMSLTVSLWCSLLPDGSQYLAVNCRTVESASTVCGSVASTRYRSPWRNVPQFPSRLVWGPDWSRSARMSHKTSAGNFCHLSILLTRPCWPPPPWPEENGAVNRQ